jgi:hypothetical protein
MWRPRGPSQLRLLVVNMTLSAHACRQLITEILQSAVGSELELPLCCSDCCSQRCQTRMAYCSLPLLELNNDSFFYSCLLHLNLIRLRVV